ncbi:MAG: hypothetical protein K9H61_04240 [Bacteroidia bacterium]|nr:hypothetical protein [Bacteroidia bacterium]MCF8426418.1 hypothetical protein [Bacteroidia bacterium]MCF8446186.1 hypothetical protein [Bacteroidia bacterium]
MKQIILILTIFLSASCGQNKDTKKATEENTIVSKKNSIPSDNAVKFINSYVENCNKMKESIGVVEWVNSNSMTTNIFKTELKKIMKEAYKIDPELGLDSDPIFDAQDYPEKGFELESFDSKTNYVVVKGKDWTDFKLTLRMVLENENWLVDGCGIINISDDKRIAI